MKTDEDLVRRALFLPLLPRSFADLPLPFTLSLSGNPPKSPSPTLSTSPFEVCSLVYLRLSRGSFIVLPLTFLRSFSFLLTSPLLRSFYDCRKGQKMYKPDWFDSAKKQRANETNVDDISNWCAKNGLGMGGGGTSSVSSSPHRVFLFFYLH